MSKKRERIFTILFMFAVTFVFTSAVSLAYLLTKDTIKLNDAVHLRRAVLCAAGLEVPNDAKKTEELYRSRVQERKRDDGSIEYFRVVEEGAERTIGYVFIEEGAGLWGTIVAAVGFDGNLENVTGVDFLAQNETPGLGARITEEWFKAQFVGKHGPFTMVPEGQPAGKTEFDAITGATITSTAVRDMLNRVVKDAPGLVAREKS